MLPEKDLWVLTSLFLAVSSVIMSRSKRIAKGNEP